MRRDANVVTRHAKLNALIQAITEEDLEGLEWQSLAARRLGRAWEGEDDSLYDYLLAR